MSLLEVRDLSVNFDTTVGFVRAVDGVSFEIEDDQILALVGETGCGKSVIANSILKLLPGNASVKGKIVYDGQNMLQMSEKEISKIRGSEISTIFQNPSMALNPVYTVGWQISEPLRVHRHMPKNKSLETARKLVTRLGFCSPDQEMKMYPFQFSGGMNQRAMIASSVILSPKLIIADEPTKGIDSDLIVEIGKLIKYVQKTNGSSLLLITHDLSFAEETSDKVVIMYSGEFVEIGRTEDFFKEPLHPYSKAFLESLPKRGFKPILGSSPSMINPPVGCKFHPRCPNKMDVCSQKKPEMVKSENRLVRCHLFV